MAYNKSNHGTFTSYIINKTLPSNHQGYKIPILWTPESLSETVSSSYDQQNIPGRSAPVISYSYTGARQVSISFTVTADYLPVGFKSVKSYVDAIKALEYPSYSSNIVTAPNASLHLLNLEINGVCSTVSIEYKMDRFTQDRGMSASVSLTFIEVQETIKGSIEIAGGAVSTYSVDGTGGNESYDEFIDSVKPKLTLTGDGLDSNYGIVWYYYTNKDSYYLGLLPEMITAINSYVAHDDVAGIKVTVYDMNASNELETFDISNGKSAMLVAYMEDGTKGLDEDMPWGKKEGLQHYLATRYDKETVLIALIYKPYDSGGNIIDSSICYRYFSFKAKTN